MNTLNSSNHEVLVTLFLLRCRPVGGPCIFYWTVLCKAAGEPWYLGTRCYRIYVFNMEQKLSARLKSHLRCKFSIIYMWNWSVVSSEATHKLESDGFVYVVTKWHTVDRGSLYRTRGHSMTR